MKMDLNVFIQLVFLCTFNVLFTISGIFLNSIVILSLSNSKRRGKLCYFMIIVLSCVDLIAVVTNHLLALMFATFWLTGRHYQLAWFTACMHVSTTFLGFSLTTLFVMNFDRYLAVRCPFIHRISVTRRRLVIAIATLCLFQTIFIAISVNNFLISSHLVVIFFLAIFSPPFLFMNYKLYTISKKIRTNNAKSSRVMSIVNRKNISSCLLAVFCHLLLSIPTYIYFSVYVTGKSKSTDMQLSVLWAKSIITMNSTFNCLIFFWKDKLLRVEGIRVIKSLKCYKHEASSISVKQSGSMTM